MVINFTCIIWQLFLKGPKLSDNGGRPLSTATDESNPWWSVFTKAIIASGGKLSKPEILASTTDARFIRQFGIPALGFSPMANTPILLHEHNEVQFWIHILSYFSAFILWFFFPMICGSMQHLKDTVFLRGIKVYEHVITALSSFPGNSS